MDSAKKNPRSTKKLRSSICKNPQCCGCSSFKRQFEKKDPTIRELDQEIASTKEDINELLDELSKYICPSVFESLGIVENLSNTQLQNPR